MKIEFIDKRMIPILNHQFKIIGENVTFEDINEFVEIGKKKVIWYEHYLFKDKNQYEEWKVRYEEVANSMFEGMHARFIIHRTCHFLFVLHNDCEAPCIHYFTYIYGHHMAGCVNYM